MRAIITKKLKEFTQDELWNICENHNNNCHGNIDYDDCPFQYLCNYFKTKDDFCPINVSDDPHHFLESHIKDRFIYLFNYYKNFYEHGDDEITIYKSYLEYPYNKSIQRKKER